MVALLQVSMPQVLLLIVHDNLHQTLICNHMEADQTHGVTYGQHIRREQASKQRAVNGELMACTDGQSHQLLTSYKKGLSCLRIPQQHGASPALGRKLHARGPSNTQFLNAPPADTVVDLEV